MHKTLCSTTYCNSNLLPRRFTIRAIKRSPWPWHHVQLLRRLRVSAACSKKRKRESLQRRAAIWRGCRCQRAQLSRSTAARHALQYCKEATRQPLSTQMNSTLHDPIHPMTNTHPCGLQARPHACICRHHATASTDHPHHTPPRHHGSPHNPLHPTITPPTPPQTCIYNSYPLHHARHVSVHSYCIYIMIARVCISGLVRRI